MVQVAWQVSDREPHAPQFLHRFGDSTSRRGFIAGVGVTQVEL